MRTRGTRLPIRCRLLRRGRPVAAGRRHRRLRRGMVVAPEGPPTQDHQRDEEENGAERHGTPLDAEPPEIRLADRRRFEQWSNVRRCRPPQRHRTPDGPRPHVHRVVQDRCARSSAVAADLDGLTGTVAGSIRAVLSASRSSRTVWSTVPARLTTSSPGPRPHRFVQCRVVFCPAGAAGAKAHVSRITRGVVRIQIEPNGVVNRISSRQPVVAPLVAQCHQRSRPPSGPVLSATV